MFFRQRLTRRLCTAVSVISLLFMQWMVAGYACAKEPVAEQASAMSAHCAEAMGLTQDTGAPVASELSVCHAHCQVDHSSLDKAESPTVPLLLAWAPGVAIALPEPVALAVAATPQDALLQRATAPPLAVRHCCFRI